MRTIPADERVRAIEHRGAAYSYYLMSALVMTAMTIFMFVLDDIHIALVMLAIYFVGSSPLLVIAIRHGLYGNAREESNASPRRRRRARAGLAVGTFLFGASGFCSLYLIAELPLMFAVVGTVFETAIWGALMYSLMLRRKAQSDERDLDSGG